MNLAVSQAIEELKLQFSSSSLKFREDDQGGAFVTIESVGLGSKYMPGETWMGFHIVGLYPYADIYPVFIDSNVSRVDGTPFQAPVTSGHIFEGRPAIQISRRNGAAPNGMQKATSKVLKILDFLEKLT